MIPYEKVINAKSKLKTQSISINKNAQKTYKERVKQQKEAKVHSSKELKDHIQKALNKYGFKGWSVLYDTSSQVTFIMGPVVSGNTYIIEAGCKPVGGTSSGIAFRMNPNGKNHTHETFRVWDAFRQMYPEAIAALKAVLTGRTPVDYVHTRLAEAYYSMGDFAVAEEEIRKEIVLSPRSASAHAVLAQLLAERGRFAEARQEYSAAISLTNDPRLKRALEEAAAALGG